MPKFTIYVPFEVIKPQRPFTGDDEKDLEYLRDSVKQVPMEFEAETYEEALEKSIEYRKKFDVYKKF